MATLVKNSLRLISQGITGGKVWMIDDTGAIADVADAAGYFTNASDYGIDSGDPIFIKANNGYTNHMVWMASFGVVQDTGATQGSLGPQTLVGDTG